MFQSSCTKRSFLLLLNFYHAFVCSFAYIHPLPSNISEISALDPFKAQCGINLKQVYELASHIGYIGSQI
jgi:hypothetical protein